MKTALLFVTLLALGFAPLSWRSTHRTVVATGYCPGPCAVCETTGVTATGAAAHSKGVAVDPRQIPLGSRLDIPGVGSWLPADDVGGAIKGNRIDIRFPTHAEARAFGKKRLEIRTWTK
jgi:3D (Asp-Asp-Asp) domain-containing protein